MGNNNSKDDKSKTVGAPKKAKKRRSQGSRDAGEYSIWYRYSGEPQDAEIPYWWWETEKLRRVSKEDILAAGRDHQITHLWVEGDLPELPVIAPAVKWLRLTKLTNHQNLKSLRDLVNLEHLEISECDMSSGVPNAILKLTTLKGLHMRLCKLTDLPDRLRQLSQLESLTVDVNNFSSGVPTVLSELKGLKDLNMRDCKLNGLPDCLVNLTQLRELNVWGNKLEELPEFLYNLHHLEELNISYNLSLKEIRKEILKLTNLKSIDCTFCTNLESPPYSVCKQGLSAIKKYFTDLASGSVDVIVAPIAVIGQTMAGKTSLIRSLKHKKRQLTYRAENDVLDQTTRVFNMEELAIDDVELKIIDFGGQSMYHISYQLTMKEKCIPVIVVSMKEFCEIAAKSGSEEATQKLCFEWISHLYLACHTLGPPILVLTHKDCLSEENFKFYKNELLKNSENIRERLLEEQAAISNEDDNFCKIKHLSNKNVKLFADGDIFDFSDDMEETSNLQSLQETLKARCSKFSERIPALWENVNLFVEGHSNMPYINVSEVENEFPDGDVKIILRYMHNSGKILYYEDIEELSQYIFHKIEAITDMILLLFNHTYRDMWKQRVTEMRPFLHSGCRIEKKDYEQRVKQFLTTGVLDEAVLLNLFEKNSKFAPSVALALLRSFFIIHGPVERGNRKAYVIPSFARDRISSEWRCDGELQVRLEIFFEGLAIPHYAYQLMSVGVMKFMPDTTFVIQAFKNGTTVRYGRRLMHFIHDYDSRSVVLQISTPVEQLNSSWQQLLHLTEHLLHRLTSFWKAARPVCKFYCAHCLFLRKPTPDYQTNPDWFQYISDRDRSPELENHLKLTFSGVEPVECPNADGDEFTVPKPLRFPCFELTSDEKSTVTKYLSAIKPFRCLPADITRTRAGDREGEGLVSVPSSAGSLEARSTAGAVSSTSTQEEPGRDLPNDDDEGEALTPATGSLQSPSALPSGLRGDEAIEGSESPSGSTHSLVAISTDEIYSASTQANKIDSTPPQAVEISSTPTLEEVAHVEDDDDSDSEISDSLEFPSESDETQDLINLQLKPCRQTRIINLFTSELVYKMSVPIRGRCLIINNKIFDLPTSDTRTGSMTDVENLSKVFRDLSFVVDKRIDLTSQEMLSAVRTETGHASHAHHGMFVLVIMSHGTENKVLGTDGQELSLNDINDCLLTRKFTAMAGKPKVVIIQACSGGRKDNKGQVRTDAIEPINAATSVPSDQTPPTPPTPEFLDVDDLFIMKASFPGYVANRNTISGSWFISALVEVLYEHACHRDLPSLFKKVQHAVRKKSHETPGPSGQLPTCNDTLMYGKKLYLFPGYNPHP